MTDNQDIFTVGEEYTSGNGRRWLCIEKSNEFAWLRNTNYEAATAYVWKLNGEAVSLSVPPSTGYDIKPGKTMTFYGCGDGYAFECAKGTYPDKKDTHKITFKIVDGQPDCASIKMERIDAD